MALGTRLLFFEAKKNFKKSEKKRQKNAKPLDKKMRIRQSSNMGFLDSMRSLYKGLTVAKVYFTQNLRDKNFAGKNGFPNSYGALLAIASHPFLPCIRGLSVHPNRRSRTRELSSKTE
jgi:hypothetical protein